MNWKRLIIFFVLGVVSSLTMASIYAEIGLYELTEYDSAASMYAALFAPDFLVAVAFYFWFAVGLEEHHFVQSFMVYLSITSLAYALQFGIFGEVFVNMLELVGSVVVAAAVTLGAYLGMVYRNRRQGIQGNA